MFALDLIHARERIEGLVVLTYALLQLTQEMVAPCGFELLGNMFERREARGEALGASMIEGSNEVKCLNPDATLLRLVHQVRKFGCSIRKLKDDR